MTGAILALICFATQALAGALLWRWLDREGPWAMRAAAALLVGPALVTVQMVGYHALGIPFHLAWLGLPWWLGLGYVWWRGQRPARERQAPSARAWPVVLGVVVFVLTASTLVRALALPIHDGDEVNNFALFAKVFGSLGSLAPERLTTLAEPGHLEYPHLVALNQAWLFAADPEGAPWSARGFEVLGLLAFMLACAAVCGARSGVRVAACSLVIAAPEVLRWAVGFADVRLLAILVLLGHEGARLGPGHDPRAMLRFACVLGTAALTKNEGLAIGVAGACVLGVVVVQQRAWRRGSVALGTALAALLLWPLLRRLIGLETSYVDRALTLPLDVLGAQAPRVLQEWAGLMFGAGAFWGWGAFWWLVVPLALLRAPRDAGTRWLLLAWLAHLGLYTYVLGAARPGDLEALLGTAAARLLLHTAVWPVLILGRALAAEGRRATQPPVLS